MTANDERPLADRTAAVRQTGRTELFRGFRALEQVRVRLNRHDGSPEISRDVLNIGRVAAVLPYDPKRERFVLIRQFRAGAHLADMPAELVEIVAGLVDPGEDAETAARRELTEETSLVANRILPLASFMPSPGFMTETADLFIAEVNADHVPDKTGADGEDEHIEPFLCSVDDALAAMDDGRFANGYTLIALLWFARHRDAIRASLLDQ